MSFLEVPLTNNHTLLIDEVDKPLLHVYKWRLFLSGHKKKPYCCAFIGRHPVGIHRMILDAHKGQVVDHVNGNGLDNRRKNIRICTVSDNQHNRGGWQKRMRQHSTAHPFYKGVWQPQKLTGRHGGRIYEAKICWAGKQRYIGAFDLPELAAMAYDDWARCFHGQFACLNFPQIGERGVHDA